MCVCVCVRTYVCVSVVCVSFQTEDYLTLRAVSIVVDRVTSQLFFSLPLPGKPREGSRVGWLPLMSSASWFALLVILFLLVVKSSGVDGNLNLRSTKIVKHDFFRGVCHKIVSFFPLQRFTAR